MAGLFQLLFRKLTKDIAKYSQNVFMSTDQEAGREERKKQKEIKLEIALRRLFAMTLSHLRRCNTRIGREGKNPICQAEALDGQASGLADLVLMSPIFVGPSAKLVDLFLEEWADVEFKTDKPLRYSIADATKVFLNCEWIGVHRDPGDLRSPHTYLYA
ncbi:hypothetical protein NQZ79_g6809 [Umbelopsis isabellina]|nr:hypothetical protein NQZ79_g6809 [Umbelopsis isabellina]